MLYRIGDRVAGATVMRITRDRVFVRLGGKQEVLKKIEAPEEPILPAPPTGAPAAAAAVPPPPPGAGRKTINRSELAGSLKDLGQMLSQAQIRQHFNTGVPDGFMISNIQQGSLYQRLGLADGDVIQELNNRRIQGADDIVELYNTLKAGDSMLLKVQRQGRQEQFDYSFR
jgi:general secretion pathway protein C